MTDNKLNKRKCIIIFSGYNQRAVVSFLRTLEKNEVIYAIIAKQNDSINNTKYKDKILSVRKFFELKLDDIIESIKLVQKNIISEEYIIAPSTEALNRFILENKSDFEKLNCTIPLVEKGLYNLVSDKFSFGELCKSNLIRVSI